MSSVRLNTSVLVPVLFIWVIKRVRAVRVLLVTKKITVFPYNGYKL